jgi:hypothetical protein
MREKGECTGKNSDAVAVFIGELVTFSLSEAATKRVIVCHAD